MAQLIKLQNYISRYEWNIYRYPSQYIRLKQDNWNKLLYLWNTDDGMTEEKDNEEEQKQSRFEKWKTFRKNKDEDEKMESESTVKRGLPQSEQELKQYFLNRLLPFQLKWATSTVSNVSFMEKKYEEDVTLKYFLQRFPDTYLLMYYPIFHIKKAPVEGEIIFISPVGIEIIYLLEEDPQCVFTVQDERTWLKRNENKDSSILSPFIALKRSERIVRGILNKYNVSFPITKTVLSRSNRIDFISEPFNTKIIDKNSCKTWFESRRSLVSPLKNQQLKAAEQLLKYCQTTSVKRPEWEEDEQTFTIVGEE
ncbi:NERD domain-containing protein [Ornithinibacillus salinisoli]|uniref:NERD domain-containing protein n=1 Tax=Ornithinibacillus salinisoli TaxID=1848459 RepID=A0ABW4W772_9BACI